MIRSGPRTLNTTASQDNQLPTFYSFSPDFSFIVPDFLSTRKRSFQNLYTFVCLYWKPMLLPSCHPKLSFCIHPIPAGCWWRSWWNRCLNVTGTIIYFYFVSYQAEEGKKSWNVQQMLISEFVYIYLPIALTQLRLKSLWCPLWCAHYFLIRPFPN